MRISINETLYTRHFMNTLLPLMTHFFNSHFIFTFTSSCSTEELMKFSELDKDSSNLGSTILLPLNNREEVHW